YPTNCDKELQDVMVSRESLLKYGGSPRMTFPDISAEKYAQHGLKDFMYIVPHYQPIAPEVPGAPGLWVTIEEADHDGEIRRLITRITTDSPPLWQYQGQYRIKRAPSLTVGEWAKQSVALRRIWAKRICDSKWGNPMRARIYARRHQLPNPTSRELADIIARKRHESILETDVNQQLSCGAEKLAVYTMECMGYDITFQQAIVDEFANRRTNLAEAKVGIKREVEEESVDGQVAKRRKKTGGIMGKEDRLYKKEAYGKSDMFDRFSDGEADQPIYIPRGTRSRPGASSSRLLSQEL
ncbi:hypothetical protein DFP72DRAFT_813387, partial [Ephemerocybe angulata]